MKSIVVLISGRGSNLAAILDAGLPAKISAVISNNPDAKGLEIARDRGVPALVIDHRQFSDRESFDEALISAIDSYAPALVVLAGFMRILTRKFVDHYSGRMINIHPSLLPQFPGLNTHERALESGVKLHGCSVHFVTSALDGGPIIVQASVPVRHGDTEKTLATRVLEQEHRIYPEAIRWFLEERLSQDGERVHIHGVPLHDDMIFNSAKMKA